MKIINHHMKKSTREEKNESDNFQYAPSRSRNVNRKLVFIIIVRLQHRTHTHVTCCDFFFSLYHCLYIICDARKFMLVTFPSFTCNNLWETFC